MKAFALVFALGMLISAVSFAEPCSKKKPDLAKGKAAYTTNCATCHGDAGDGNGPAGQYLNPKPRNFSKDDFKNGGKKPNADQVLSTIEKGVPNTPMVSFTQVIKDENERCDVAHYVLGFRKK